MQSVPVDLSGIVILWVAGAIFIVHGVPFKEIPLNVLEQCFPNAGPQTLLASLCEISQSVHFCK